MTRLTRRRLVQLVSFAALFGFAMLMAGSYLGVTRTERGRALVRDLIVRQLEPRVNGRLYVGRISGGLVGDVTIDSLEIRGADDSLFVASGPISITFDPRDLLDKRILIRTLDIRRPVVHVKEWTSGDWNYKRIIKRDPPGPRSVARSYGDFIVIDTTTVHDASFTLTQRWTPSDTLKGAKLDSAIRVALENEAGGIHREPGFGFMRSWRWRHGFAASGHIRLAHPDSAGQYFRVSRIDVTETYPPFKFSGIRGEIRRVHDSVWVEIPRFDLTASTGRASGKLVWGSGLPMRYDLRIIGDSVSMSDVAWIYPTLPTTGGGRTLLHIRNDPANLRVINYALTEMDVRSTRSHLTGDMTFGVGGPVLVVKDVAMRADSVDFDLLRTFNGEPFPYDWQGKLVGTVRASGGPVNRFRIDDANFTFVDANVPGAISRARARGEVDILFPAFTAFRGLQVESDRVDLRTIQFLNPEFAPLGGFARGRAVLDSSWLDVRFNNADFEHVDGPAPPSRFTGAGRITWGEQFMTYDVDLLAAPLSMTTMARSYPYLPVRGLFAGPVRAKGTADALQVDTELTGNAGKFIWSGLVDTDSSSYAATGNGRFESLNVRSLLENPAVSLTSLNGQFTLDVRGDSLSDLVGAADLRLDSSVLDSLSVLPSRASVRFAAGVLHVDSLRLETTAGTAVAQGSFGLVGGRADSLTFSAQVDSLGGLRQYLRSAFSTTPDSLGGNLAANGVLVGSLDSASLSVDVRGRELQRNDMRASSLIGQLDLENVFGARHGTGTLTLDTLQLGTMSFPRVSGEAYFLDTLHTAFTAQARGINGTQYSGAGRITRGTDLTEILLDTVRVLAGAAIWNLERGGRIRVAPSGTLTDSLVLRERRGGELMVHASIPVSNPIHGEAVGDSISLSDVALLLQRPDTIHGFLDFSATLGGTRELPTLQLESALSDVLFGTALIEKVTARSGYRDRRLDATMEWLKSGSPVLTGTLSLPIDLALAPRERRVLPEPLTGRIRADSTDLSLIQTFTKSIDVARGSLDVDLWLSGTAEKPLVNGSVRVANGEVHTPLQGDVSVRNIGADIRFLGDSVKIERFAGVSGPREAVSLGGVVGFALLDDPTFNLRLAATNLHAVANRRFADLWLSGILTLTGSASAAVLEGNVEVNSGSIYIPEFVQKRVVRLDDPALFDIVDTSVFGSRALLPTPPPLLVRNLEVRGARLSMGPDVWLRSSEADINLGGSVSIDRVRVAEADSSGVRLTLDGAFQTVRGTYRLNVAGLVQREFEVEGGNIRFFPDDPTLNPTLAINAIHTVRRISSEEALEQDRRIRISISGTLTEPVLSLGSADNMQLSQTDLLSYLITGGPAFGVGDPTSQATAGAVTAGIVFSALGSAFSSYATQLLDQVGIRPDVLSIQTGLSRTASFGGYVDASNALLQGVRGTRLTAGQQIGENTFIRANAGFCWAAGNLSGVERADALFRSVGLKIERRLNSETTLSAGIEPSTSGVICEATEGTTTRGFTQTPTQIGVDLVRRWRF